MKKFVKELLTNRFGIVLAALNICWIVSAKFVSFVFAHQHGERCSYYKKLFLLIYQDSQLTQFGVLINLPAFTASAVQGRLFMEVFPDLCAFTQLKIQIVFFTFFVAVQWLFIAWLSYKIARKIRGN